MVEKIIQRGDWSKLRGVWLPRTRKHRYAYIFDKTLVCLHKEQPHPTQKNTISVECCQGTKKVIDNRNGITYTCPKCCGYMHIINNGIEEKTETNPLKIALMRKKLYQSQ
ncbi:MAG: hypothetical protein MJZ34_07130 [Paludibacteraceae bacterium]|nr:hypothetical protein [Paludibacteraceae bacterium]